LSAGANAALVFQLLPNASYLIMRFFCQRDFSGYSIAWFIFGAALTRQKGDLFPHRDDLTNQLLIWTVSY
jgi:hypothetical protein